MRYGRSVAPIPDRRRGAGPIVASSAALTSAIRPSLTRHLADRDEPVRQVRLQPHEFEVLAQRFLVLAEAFADLAQALPRLGGVGANRRQGAEQPLGRGEVALRRQQLAQPVQRVGVPRLDLQNPPVAAFRIGGLSLPVKFGRLLQHVGNASRVDPAAEFLPFLVSTTVQRILRSVQPNEYLYGSLPRRKSYSAKPFSIAWRMLKACRIMPGGGPSKVSSRPVM